MASVLMTVHLVEGFGSPQAVCDRLGVDLARYDDDRKIVVAFPGRGLVHGITERDLVAALASRFGPEPRLFVQGRFGQEPVSLANLLGDRIVRLQTFIGRPWGRRIVSVLRRQWLEHLETYPEAGQLSRIKCSLEAGVTVRATTATICEAIATFPGLEMEVVLQTEQEHLMFDIALSLTRPRPWINFVMRDADTSFACLPGCF